MNRPAQLPTLAITAAASLAMFPAATADTVITNFDDFNLDGLFAWSDAVVDSGLEAYSITDSGYGSGYKNISPNIDASGETTLELTVTLSADAGPTAPISGPIVSLVDGDGTFVNFAWYGQTIGRRVLTADLTAPTSVSNPGRVPGLNLATLDFFHLQNDPGAFKGTYTITFENLRLAGAPGPVIESQTYDSATHDLALVWTSLPDRLYSILYSSTLSGTFSPLATDLESGGITTTATVTLPEGEFGFVEVQQQ